MKMTLSSPNTSSDRQSGTSDKSPSSSPRGSPRPSPRPQTKREHCSKSDTYLTVNYNSTPASSTSKQDGSPTTPDTSSRMSTSSDLLTQPPELNRSESTGGSSTKGRNKDGRVKKKSSWFNSLYPTYKSRSEDFKRIFKEVPDDERLVVDYSCALQKDILVQGRLYVSQNYLCFYANIFGWETNVTLKWKDVAAITKEKTALVIPNAVLICTRQEKFFFTSFVTRDKTYMMLFRVWQNALMDQPMSAQEMWQWVHNSYGDELGLTSDDEDYVAPGTEDDKLSARLSVESFSEQEGGSNADGMESNATDDRHDDDHVQLPPMNVNNVILNNDGHQPTDLSDTTESEAEKTKYETTVECTSSHEGRQLVNEVLPIHIDQLFTLLFTNSKFYLDFHASRKTTDLTQTPWTHNPLDNSKSRVVNLTVALNQTVGPKTAQVTETQVMMPCSKAGHLYSIDIETVNANIPYADSFCVLVHYCLRKVSETQSSLTVCAQIKYKKSVWGLVKGMIEKNCWQGLDDFFTALSKALLLEGEDIVYPTVKRKSRRKRRVHSLQRCTDDVRSSQATASRTKLSTSGVFSSDFATTIVFSVLLLLLILNVMLYYKLWSLEEAPPYTLLDLHVLKDPPTSHEDWIKLLQQQETFHSVEMEKWQRVLKTAIKLLRQTEESLVELQRSIHPTYTDKVMSVVQNHKDTMRKTEL